MNYELAEKLKNAGFFQVGEGRYFFLKTSSIGFTTLPIPGALYKPLLSELIEACGEEFDSLKKSELYAEVNNNGEKWWCASGRPLGNGWQTVGATPEEAVGNLWLQINKKIS